MYNLRFRLKVCFIVFLLFIPFYSLQAKHRSYSVILKARNSGMFCIFCDVLALLRSYENHLFTSVEVDFGTTGLYYDSNYGPNWWEYYFEPISLGIKNPRYLKEITGNHQYINQPVFIAFNTPKEELHRLIQNYIRIKPHIQEKIDQFVENHFTDCTMIGIHYRGTDKFIEAPRVLYESIADLLLQEIEKRGLINYKIFVATDEQAFLDYMISIFNDRVCYSMESERSSDGKPLHLNLSKDQYKVGESALIDCVLLSKTNLLFRTSSNLNKVSTFFNPNLEEIELSQDYLETKFRLKNKGL